MCVFVGERTCTRVVFGVVVVSCRVVACLVASCGVVSCCVMSCCVVSCRVVSCCVVSCRIVSWHVSSCRVVSCRFVACLVLSCLRLQVQSDRARFPQVRRCRTPNVQFFNNDLLREFLYISAAERKGKVWCVLRS